MSDSVLGRLVTRILGDNTHFLKSLKESESAMIATGAAFKAMGQQITSLGRSLTFSMTLPIVGIAAASTKAYADFEDAMTGSLAIMQDVNPEIRRSMEETALAISEQTATSAKDLADSYYFLASAGKSAAQSEMLLADVQRFSAAGRFDMATATDLLTDAQSALGLTSKDIVQDQKNLVRVSDAIVRAATLANASVEGFSKALVTKAAPALKVLNRDVEEGLAVLAAFADQGIKAEQGGEKLHIVLRDLQTASEKSTENWERLGLSIHDANGKVRPFVDIISDLEDAFAPMSDQQKKAAASMLGFQDRSFSALQSLLGTSDAIRRYQEELYNASGFTKSVAEKQMQSFSMQMKVLWNQIKNVGIEIGRELVPYLKKLVGGVKEALAWWRGLSDEAKRFLLIGAGILAVLGPILTLMGFMVTMIGNLIAVLGGASLATVGWVVLIGALVAALALAADAILQMTDQGNLGILELVQSFRVGGHQIGTWMTAIWWEIGKAWLEEEEKIVKSWETTKWAVVEIGETLYREMAKIAMKISNAFLDALDFLSNGTFKKELTDAQKAVNAYLNDAIFESSRRSVAKFNSLGSSLSKTSAEYDFRKKTVQKEIDRIFQADLDLAAKEREKNKFKGPETPEIPEVKIPDLSELEAKKFRKQFDLDNFFAGDSETDISQPAQFQQIALRRFALNGPGGLSQSAEPQQKVSAPKVEEKLDKLISVTEQHCVLG